MNTEGSSSNSERAIIDDLDFDIDGILDSWIDDLMDDNCELVMSSGVETMTINPGPCQPIMSTLNSNTNLKGGSANQSQYGIAKEMTSMSSLIPNYSTYISGQVLSAEPIYSYVTNSAAHNSQLGRTTAYSQYHHIQSTQSNQNPPSLQHVFNNNSSQQPLTHALADQSNITFSNQKNEIQYQVGALQNPTLQTQQNPNQQQLQLQQDTGTAASAGFVAPTELYPPAAWREYALTQIRLMKEKYFSDLLKMHRKATQFRNQATHVEASKEYQRVIVFLEKMLTFLSISTDEGLPINNQKTYGYMTQIANYVKYHMDKSVASSQHPEPGGHPSRRHVHPNRRRKLLYNPPPNPSTGVVNLDDMANFNQNYPSRRLQTGRMPSVQNNRSSQIGIDQQPVNNLQRIGSFKAPQPIGLNTSQQVNSGSKNSSVNASGFPVDLPSNTTASNFTSRPLNNQPAAANQKLNLEKMKQPMYKTDEPNESKGGQAMSPLGSKLLNPGHSPQFSRPLTQKPISQQTASPQWSSWLSTVTSSGFDVNHVLSPESIARSPFILSFSPNTSGQSSLSTAESKTLKTPVDPPCKEQGQEEEKPKDPIQRLVDAVKSMSSKAMRSSLTAISSLKRDMDIVPNIEPPYTLGSYINDKENAMLENDNEPERKIRRKLSVSSVSQDPFNFEEWPEIENKGTILAEIKQINNKLLETSMVVVSESAQGTMVHCMFRNVCFRDLLGPRAGVSSEKMPEFVTQLLVPVSYPALAPKISNLCSNVLSEPWGKLYEKMVTRFDVALRGVVGQMMLGDIAQKWDASVRFVMTEFVQKMGGQSFSSIHGSWESCVHSSSGSN
uniref:mediator of RNA polymerase II transcription subunit 15a-like n=1 Tax=Erigeron canadensis TaxID=72917 RepID=UPI001CB96FCE|nr:mediator of RNA polymerase II transcription subunit 15a-like [Erigeron canadensis]